MNREQFRNGIRILYGIDAWELGNPKWWPEFQRDPYRFLMRCDDATAEIIWRVMIDRGLKGTSQ